MRKNNTFGTALSQQALYEACVEGKNAAVRWMEDGEKTVFPNTLRGRAAAFAFANQRMFGEPGRGSVMLDATRDLMEIIGDFEISKSVAVVSAWYNQDDYYNDYNVPMWIFKIHMGH